MQIHFGILYRKDENSHLKTYMHPNVHSSCIYNKQDMKQPKSPQTDECIKKRWLMYKDCCCSVVSGSLWPHGLQHARLPCPSLFPRVCSNSCPLSQWCQTNYLILCRFLFLLPSIFPFIRVFSIELAFHIRYPKYRSFNISPSKEYSG